MGGKKQSKPTTTDDNLFSQDIFEILLGFGEGTVYGLVDGFKSFLIDGTPLIANDDSFNFQDFAVSMTQGYEDDHNGAGIHLLLGGSSSALAGASGTSLPHGITRSYSTDPSLRGTLTGLDIRIAVNALFTGDANGNTNFGKADLEIKYKRTSDTNWRYIVKEGGQVTTELAAIIADSKAAAQTAYSTTYAVILAAGGNRSAATRFATEEYNRVYAETYAAKLADHGLDPTSGTVFNIFKKTTSGAIVGVKATLEPNPDEDWMIQITKLNADLTPVQRQYSANDLGISSIYQVGKNDIPYPNTVITQIIAQATSRFSALPNFTGEFYGLMVDVPTNYNPWTKTYDESTPWLGTYKKAWTNNPVWLCREVIMNPSWGIRKRQQNVQISNANFYSAAKYCDEKILDFDGNLTARHTYNEIKSDKTNITDFLLYLAGSFHAVTRERNGVYTLHIDRAQAPIFFICPETCVIGSMVYAGTDMSTRYNFVRASYANQFYNYTGDRRLLTDGNSIAKYGQIEYEFQPAGVTNRTEAIRAAAYVLLTNRDESLIVTATVPQLGLLLSLYDNFFVADKDAGMGNSARILDYVPATKTITLRDPITVTGGTYDITWHSGTGLIKRTATTPNAYTLVLDSATTYLEENWLFDECPILIEGGSYAYAKQFRIMGISDNAQANGDGSGGIPSGVLFSISGSQVSTQKYVALDNITNLEDYGLSYDSTQAVNTGITTLSIPSGIAVTATTDGKYNIGFNVVAGADQYTVSWKNVNTGIEYSMITPTNSAILSPAFPVDGVTPVNFTVIASGSGLTSSAGTLLNYLPQFSTLVELPNILSIALVKGQIKAVWEAEGVNMPAYDQLKATISTPNSGVQFVTLTPHSTEASIDYDGAGTYNLQLTYQSGNPVVVAEFTNKIWSFVAPVIPPILLPIFNAKYSSTTGMISGVTADTGYAFVQFDAQVIDKVTNPILADYDNPLEIQYEKYLGTGIFEDTPDDFFNAQLDSTHYRGIIVPQLKIGQAVRFRTTGGTLTSNWVTFTVGSTMVSPPSPSPSDVFLAAAGI